MSGTSLDGVDAVLAEIGSAGQIRLLRTHYLPYADSLRAQAAGAAHAAARRNPPCRLRRQRTGAPVCRGGQRDCSTGSPQHRARDRLSRPDPAPPPCRRLHPANRQCRPAGRTHRHHGRRRLPQPRHRRGRPGRAAGARLPRPDSAASAKSTASSPTSAASPTSPICQQMARCAAGTPAPATCCWMRGSSGTAAPTTTATAPGQPAEPSIPACWRRWRITPTCTSRRPRAPGANSSTWTGWTRRSPRSAAAIAPADVQATLLEFTAVSLADAVSRECGGAQELYVCGGGAHNGALMQRIQRAPAGRSGWRPPLRSASTRTGWKRSPLPGWHGRRCIMRRATCRR